MKQANKKALSYESSFGIPVEMISPGICHPEIFTLYHSRLEIINTVMGVNKT